ncbi:hypothetical protein DFH07DRAFT_767543 [Mycena maculata]|uniref:Uncharacterized protein n=1 Tax=Mycena maculata TaxID=230809 RepID=A0AAD7JZ61_9AGAR|nr:hypothetical protein DFH07DRAFT_767543 [Mycena maculata]
MFGKPPPRTQRFLHPSPGPVFGLPSRPHSPHPGILNTAARSKSLRCFEQWPRIWMSRSPPNWGKGLARDNRQHDLGDAFKGCLWGVVGEDTECQPGQRGNISGTRAERRQGDGQAWIMKAMVVDSKHLVSTTSAEAKHAGPANIFRFGKRAKSRDGAFPEGHSWQSEDFKLGKSLMAAEKIPERGRVEGVCVIVGKKFWLL